MDWLDAARGGAVVAMVAYHILFDARFFAGVDVFAGVPWAWLAGTRAITFVFMFCSGIASYASTGGGRRFFERQLRLAGAASMVTLSTAVFFPGMTIYFGVLHCILVAGFVARFFRNCPGTALWVGVAVLAGWAAGFVPEIPARPGGGTLDYAPLVPWIGVVLLGVGAGPAATGNRTLVGWRGVGVLNCAGRHSLVIYLLHQPVIIGVFVVLSRLLSP